MAEDEHRPGPPFSGRKATLGCALLGAGKGRCCTTCRAWRDFRASSLSRWQTSMGSAWPRRPGSRLRQRRSRTGAPRSSIRTSKPSSSACRGLHAPSSRAALAGRLHVYVEKPLATALEDADAVIDVWRTSGCIGMVGLNYRFNELYRSARATLADGRLGELVAVRSVFPIPAAGVPAWKLGRAAGGGALLDLWSAPPSISSGGSWGEPVAEVSTGISSQRSERTTRHLSSCASRAACVVHSLLAFGPPSEDRFEVYGLEGTLVVDRVRHNTAAVQQVDGSSGAPRAGSARRLAAGLSYAYSKRRAPGNEPCARRCPLVLCRCGADGGAGAP